MKIGKNHLVCHRKIYKMYNKFLRETNLENLKKITIKLSSLKRFKNDRIHNSAQQKIQFVKHLIF